MSDISSLFKNGRTLQFKKNDFFISPKKQPLGIYQVTDGFIFSYSKSSRNKKRIQTILKKGDLFPIAWAINVNNTRRDMYVQALTDGSVQLIEKEIFLNSINKSHKAAKEIISVLLMYLSLYVDRVQNLEDDSVKEKLVDRLLFFAERFGHKTGKKVIINLPVTHKLIADSISVSRENVSRELKALENKQIISFENRQLMIENLEMLKKEL